MPLRYYRIGPVSVAFSVVRHGGRTLQGVRRDFHRLYARHETRCPAPEALDVCVAARRSLHSLRTYYHISVDGEERFAVRSPASILPHVEWAINVGVMRTLPRYYQIHAGVVSRDGVGLILPGEPQSGKSTLVAGLLRRGWRYLSDEFALIDPDTLRLIPYPKAICIKQGSFDAVRRVGLGFAFDRDYSKGVKGKVRFVDPYGIRHDIVSEPVPVRLIIFPKYVAPARETGGKARSLTVAARCRPAPQTPAIEPMSRARAVFELAQVSFTYNRFRAQAVELLADVAQGASCYRLKTGDLEASCDLIERCLDDVLGGSAR